MQQTAQIPPVSAMSETGRVTYVAKGDPQLFDTPAERLVKDGGGVTEADLAAFERLGVDRETAVLFGAVLEGELDPPHFIPYRDGRRHLAAIVRGWDGDAIADTPEAGRIAATIGDVRDLVAFNHRDPARFGFVTGARPILGSIAWRGATVVHPHPIDWLRAGGRGCVILDERGAWPVLAEAESIEATALATAKRVRDLLARPLPTPPILVRTEARAVA